MKKKNKCIYCNSEIILTHGGVYIGNKAYASKTYLVQCEDCKIYWIYPTPNMQKLSEIYGEAYHFDRNKLREAFFELYINQDILSDVRLIKKYKNRGKILDIGAGRGDFLTKFSSHDWERWAFDPFFSAKEIAVLKKRIGKNVQNYKLLKKYPSNFFDLVILRNVLEHTTKFPELLKEVQRILKKGGVVFIRTPNMKSLDFYFFRTNWYCIIMPGHIVFYDMNSLESILTKYKLRTICNHPVSISGPLSLSRSIHVAMPKVFLYTLSFAFSGFSYLYKGSGDFRIVAKK